MSEARNDVVGRREGRPDTAALRTGPRPVGEVDHLRRAGAALPPTVGQWTALVAVVGAAAGSAVLWPASTGTAVHHLFYAVFALAALSRLAAGLSPDPRALPAPLPDAALPRYTVLAPLYREAEIAPQLIAALGAIDYPRDRLQVLCVVEADDPATLSALLDAELPPHAEVLVAPPGHPRTKPRACNVALERATGELLTIYDAEDRPHPGQLREAAARFATGSARLACLQAPLRIDEDHRFLPRQFGLEYAIQFEALMPMLTRLGLPFPLGGTSNHFRGIM